MLDFYAKMYTTPKKKDPIHARKRKLDPLPLQKCTLLFSWIFLSIVSLAQPTDLFFSEYVEGSSLNKALEIFNGTGSSVDLATYSVQIFFNGNSTAGATIPLSGTLADGDVFVIADDAADQAILNEADLTPTNNFFNGDDAVTLLKNGVIIDVFGQIGTDPGSSWPGGGANVTLRRKSSITSGDTNGSDAFDASTEWDSFANDTFDGLGSHSISTTPVACSGPTITQQPQSVSVVVGSPVSFIAVASGVGTLSYQWQLRANGAGSFFDIGITSETLTFPSPGLPSDGNQYRVIITDDNGTPNDDSDDCEVTSDAATLNVRLPIAITEFMNNSVGNDREFIELVNFGTTPIDLAGWTLSDEGANNVVFPPYTLAPDGYLLVVLSTPSESVADAKADFEREWFLGVPQDNILVVANSAFILGNAGDEIILKDGNGDISWSLAYGDDETEGRATFLTSTDYLNIPNVYGSMASPGIDRNGNDLGMMNFLGYESNDNTADPDAVTSADGNVGSPQGEATPRTAFVAITEFMNNSVGNDREFVELRNYGTTPIDLAGWTLSDEGANNVAFPPYTLAPDGYLLVVLSTPSESVADAKADFEREWFSGVPQDNILVVANSAFILGNAGDEIILKDGNGDISWSLAYTDDETEGRATFLTSTDYLNIPNVYGSMASPGIDRNGNDLGQANFLGYESNDNTVDPDAITSEDGNVGSPQGEASPPTVFVAITEFMNNSLGNDREFVELRNYGTTPVDLAGWTLSDEDANNVVFPPYTLAPDGYLLVVLSTPSESVADAKADFEREWFSGVPQDNILVVANSAFILGNAGDEIILKDGNGDISWSLAYTDDETEGRATFLTSTDYENIPNIYGSKASPGVNRDGNDLGQPNFLGYESNDNTVDSDAVTSADGNVGSPVGEVAVTPCTGPTITLQPRDSSASVGGRADFAVVASGVGTLSYQWQLKALQDTGFTNIAETTPFLSVSSVEVTDDGNQYRVIISDDNGTPNDNSDDCQVTSDAATLTVTGGADTEDPVAVCQDITVWLDASGKARITAADVDGGSTDNVGITSMFVDPDTFDCSDVFIDNSPSDLFFSEYVEGSSLNKALEIFNGTGSAVDLSTYSVQIFFNGNSSAGATIPLSGTLADGDVFVIADDGADAAITAEADLTPTNSFFNGDDAITLLKNGVIIDVFGQIGTDPGSSWPGGGANVTLRRKASISAGDTNGADAFDASVEWDSFASNTFDGLGNHSINAGGPSSVPVSLSIFDAAGNFASCTANVTVSDTTSPSIITQNITVYLDGIGQASIVPADVDNGTTDNCSIASLSLDKTDFSCSDVGSGEPTELFISEYVEGSGFNKYIEIFNGTGSSVDLSAYELRLYSNGASTPTTTSSLSGTLADGKVVVLQNSQANIFFDSVTTVLTVSAVNFNGDDAVELFNTSSGQSVDVFGQIGVDPGSSWPGGGANVTLRRKVSIFSGDTNGADAFDASIEWDSFASNTVSGLGSHTFFPPAIITPVIFTATDESGNVSSKLVRITVLDTTGFCTLGSIAIHDVQGAGHTSPFEGQTVKIDGIVTAVDDNGFYLQEPDGDIDGDDATSEGIFVFTSSTPTVIVNDSAEVTGTVVEFIPGGASTGNLSITEIVSPIVIVLSSGSGFATGKRQHTPIVVGSGGRVPPTEVIADDPFTDFDPVNEGIDFFESLEGMLVTVPDAKAVAATNRFGEIFTVANQGARATGLNARMGITLRENDFNPEKIQIDEDSGIFPGFSFPPVSTGDLLGDITGVISYSFGNFEVLPTEEFSIQTASGLNAEITTVPVEGGNLTIASYNVLNLDPNDTDGDSDIADGRFDLIASQIINNLSTPDIIGLQEVQDDSGSDNDGTTSASTTLQTLIDAITAAGGPTYGFIDNTFISNNLNGGQPGGNIRVAFLYNPGRVGVKTGSVQAVGDQNAGSPFLGSRLPLATTFEFNGQEVTVINNHFSSKGGSDPLFGVTQPNPLNGNLAEREAQALEVRSFINDLLDTDPAANVVTLGDFNDFDFEDFLDVTMETGGNEPLFNLVKTLDPVERYTFNFQGNSQALDHFFVSNSLNELMPSFDIVHANSEFPFSDAKASDHDPVVASFQISPLFVKSFIMVDADNNTEVTEIKDGDVFLLENLPENFNIIAIVEGPESTDRVFLDLNGPVENERTERKDPYAVFGDRNGDYTGRPTEAGEYDITAVPFYLDGGLVEGTSLTVFFEIIDCAVSGPIADAGDDTSLDCNSGDATLTSNFIGGLGEVSRSWSGPNNFSDTSQTTIVSVAGLYTLTVTDLMTGCTSTDEVLVEPCPVDCTPEVSQFVLVDSDTDQDIMVLSDGAMIDLTMVGWDLNIRADVLCGNKTESVKLELTGAQSRTRTENKAPYALAGDSNGNYSDQNFIPGSYTLTATPFTQKNAQGTMGTPLTINFTVMNGAPAPQTGFGEPSLNPDYELSVFPVPANEEFNIDMKFFEEGVYQAEMFDVAGRAVISKKLVYDEVTGKRFIINTQNLAVGVYMLRISGQNYQEWKKVPVRR